MIPHKRHENTLCHVFRNRSQNGRGRARFPEGLLLVVHRDMLAHHAQRRLQDTLSRRSPAPPDDRALYLAARAWNLAASARPCVHYDTVARDPLCINRLHPNSRGRHREQDCNLRRLALICAGDGIDSLRPMQGLKMRGLVL